jgi:hypothetical protein
MIKQMKFGGGERGKKRGGKIQKDIALNLHDEAQRIFRYTNRNRTFALLGLILLPSIALVSCGLLVRHAELILLSLPPFPLSLVFRVKI